MKTAFSKRALSFFLSLLFVFSLSSAALAADYTDVSSKHWAKGYIDTLTEKGFFSGYEDGSFRPDGKITYCETLVLLSRFFVLDENALELIFMDYSAAVSAAVPASLSWANKELCVCLAAGIISPAELSSIELSSAIDKQRFSLLLVRAIGMSKDIIYANSYVLPFSDAGELVGDYHGCVSILYDLGIIDGDENNRFNPTETVSRAIASAMLARTIACTAEEDFDFSLPEYKGLSRFSGIIRAVESDSIRLELASGEIIELPTKSTARIMINGSAAALSSLQSGSYADILTKNGAVISVNVNSSDNTLYVSGTLQSISTIATGSIGLYPTGSAQLARFVLSENAKVQLNGTAAALSSLDIRQRVFLKQEGNLVTELYAYNYQTSLTGTLSSLEFGTTTELKITDENGIIHCVSYDISALPAVYLGNYEISIDRLSIGSKISVAFSNGTPGKITAEATESSVSGKVTSIIDTVSGLYWDITDDSGNTNRFLIAENVTVYNGKTSILLSAIKVGNRVSVTVLNSSITSINLESSDTTVQTGKLSGKVLKVDPINRQLLILISDKLYYINALPSAPTYSALDGKLLGLSQISQNSEIVVYGTYENSTTLKGTLIVVEVLA